MLYRYCLKLIGELRKEKEFRQQYCRNSTKIGERKRKRWREKEEEFRQHCYQNSFAQIPAPLVSCVLKKSNYGNAIAEIGKKRNFFFGNCGNDIVENGKKKNWMELWQCHCRKWEEKKFCCRNLGRNLKKSVMFTIFL